MWLPDDIEQMATLGVRVQPAMKNQYELELRPQPFAETHSAFRATGNLPAIVAAVEPHADKLGGPLRAQKAPPALLPADINVSDAFRLTIVQCRWHVAANAAVFVEGRAPEAIHQLRVGLRRLRVALVSFGAEFRTPQFEAVRLRAKDIAHRLAPARDLDVFVSELLEPAASANGSQQGFAVLRRRAENARQRAFADAFSVVSGPRLGALMRDVGDVADGRGWPFPPYQGPGAVTGIHAYGLPARATAQRILAHRYKQACKRARHLDRLSALERHALRIELKKLRYAAEFFVPFFDSGRARKFLSRLARMQDVLGTVNDVAVARNILDMLVAIAEPADVSANEVSFAAGLVYGWHLARAAHTWREAVERWKRFSQTRTFWTGSAV
jgi:triphosphatase